MEKFYKHGKKLYKSRNYEYAYINYKKYINMHQAIEEHSTYKVIT